MSDKRTVNVQLASPAFLLFLAFLVLKLTGVISWSWWWITAPLWGGIALFLVILAAIFLVALLVAILDK